MRNMKKYTGVVQEFQYSNNSSVQNKQRKWGRNHQDDSKTFSWAKEHEVEKAYWVLSKMDVFKYKLRHIRVKFQVTGPNRSFYASREEKNLLTKVTRNQLALDFFVVTLETKQAMAHHLQNSEGK